MGSLTERQASLLVRVVDLLDRVHVGRGSQVQTQVVLHGGSHDLLEGEKGGG